MDRYTYRKCGKNSADSSRGDVRNQYEHYPYPRVPLVVRSRRIDSYLMNYEAVFSAVFGTLRFAKNRPRILVAGAGAFEACIVALANRGADILAVDLSSSSLQRLRKHLFRHGIWKQVELEQLDIASLSDRHGKFDYIVATGLLHHLPDPALGLAKLESHLNVNGVMRVLLYSKFGREAVYRIQDFALAMGIREPKKLRFAINALPADHPLRIHFHIYRDSENDIGLVDGFLHACDQGFDAHGCGDFLAASGLVAKKFLHPPGSLPGDLQEIVAQNPLWKQTYEHLGDWEKLAVLDRLRLLETNYNFLACREADFTAMKNSRSEFLSQATLNPVIAECLRGPLAKIQIRKIYSRLERGFLPIHPTLHRMARRSLAIDALTLSREIGLDLYKRYTDSLMLLEGGE